MTGTRAAVRYAKAVLDLAKDQNVMEAVNTDMKTILSTHYPEQRKYKWYLRAR